LPSVKLEREESGNLRLHYGKAGAEGVLDLPSQLDEYFSRRLQAGEVRRQVPSESLIDEVVPFHRTPEESLRHSLSPESIGRQLTIKRLLERRSWSDYSETKWNPKLKPDRVQIAQPKHRP